MDRIEFVLFPLLHEIRLFEVGIWSKVEQMPSFQMLSFIFVLQHWWIDAKTHLTTVSWIVSIEATRFLLICWVIHSFWSSHHTTISPSKHSEGSQIFKLIVLFCFADGKKKDYFETGYVDAMWGKSINTAKHTLAPVLLVWSMFGDRFPPLSLDKNTQQPPESLSSTKSHFIVINITSYKKIKIWKVVVVKNIWQKKKKTVSSCVKYRLVVQRNMAGLCGAGE